MVTVLPDFELFVWLFNSLSIIEMHILLIINQPKIKLSIWWMHEMASSLLNILFSYCWPPKETLMEN